MPRPSYQVNDVGDCTLILGDSRRYIPRIEWHSVDLVLTDPPYGISYKTNMRTRTPVADMIDGDESLDIVQEVLPMTSGKLAVDGGMYCFCSSRMAHKVVPIIEGFLRFKNLLVWDKIGTTCGDVYGSYASRYENIVYATKGSGRRLKKRGPDIIRVTRGNMADPCHPNQKPEELLRYLIENTTDEGDLVFDPFMGSGMTAKACVTLRRRFVGCEVDAGYYATALANVRWSYAKQGDPMVAQGPLGAKGKPG